MGQRHPVRADYTMTLPLRVRYNEADMQGVVFNANYLVYADLAVTEYFRQLGYATMQAFGPTGDVMVRKVEIDYRASARPDDLLDLYGRFTRFANSSMDFEVAIFRDNELLTVIDMRYVHFAVSDGRPSPVPQHFRDKVAGYEKIAPIV